MAKNDIDKMVNLVIEWTGEVPEDFQKLFEKFNIEGMTSTSTVWLINQLVKLIKNPLHVYFEIGTHQGRSLVGAAYQNKTRCVGLDNFSGGFGPKEKVDENIFKKFKLKNASYFEHDFKTFLDKTIELYGCDNAGNKNSTPDKVRVYFYDGPHEYDYQVWGLIKAQHLFADQCLILVDDAEYNSEVWKACRDVVKAYPQFVWIKDFPDRSIFSENGLIVLKYDKNRI